MNPPTRTPHWLPWMVAALLAAGVFTLRWPTFDFQVWNVDEAIHAAVARTLLDGGVLYRDTIDQRTPLSYHAVAALFGFAGENNIRAMHALAAVLIAATAFGLFLLGRNLRNTATGLWAALLFAVLSSTLFFPGDAYALNTEWFVAFFTAWAAWLFWRGPVGYGGLVAVGAIFSLAFLSKQPALLDLGAPLLVLLCHGSPGRFRRIGFLLAGFALPVLLVAAGYAARGAGGDFLFYAWSYNLQYYAPEISAGERLLSAGKPFLLLGSHYPLVLLAVLGAAVFSLFRVMQARPDDAERAANPPLLYLLAWLVTSLAGAAAGGRGFDHYFIQFLPVACLAAAWALGSLPVWARAQRMRSLAVPAVWLGLTVILASLAWGVIQSRRQPPLPVDPSLRVSAYIREHSAPADRIFVWGYHPDIYLFADRKPASRFVYASFLTGLIPWTNIAPERDTAYAVVPGTMDVLLRELAAAQPAFIVDCSAGPNRHWQKYPLEKFPVLHDFIRRHYEVVEAGQFVPQGFRLFQRRAAGASPESPAGPPELPVEITSTLKLGTVAAVLVPVRASAPHGVDVSMVDGRLEYFAHAPSSIVYRLPAGGGALRGGFGLRPAAYGLENKAPTDGAEFIIRWRPANGGVQVLLRRLLRPREEAADRGRQSFRVELPAWPGGELELAITAGPTGNPASDWTYWSDLLLETTR